MANRHKMCKAKGGATSMSGRTAYDGQGSNVMKEAKQLKGGGKVAGSKGRSRIKKAGGGGVGSDKNPFSSAHRG
jgi:hypothetical protein